MYDFFWFILFGMLYFLDLDVYFFLQLREVVTYYFFKRVICSFFSLLSFWWDSYNANVVQWSFKLSSYFKSLSLHRLDDFRYFVFHITYRAQQHIPLWSPELCALEVCSLWAACTSGVEGLTAVGMLVGGLAPSPAGCEALPCVVALGCWKVGYISLAIDWVAQSGSGWYSQLSTWLREVAGLVLAYWRVGTGPCRVHLCGQRGNRPSANMLHGMALFQAVTG